MYDLMDGVRVVEVAEHTFVPAAGMLLADWGADVIKIERTSGGGDASRSLRIPMAPENGLNPYFEAANRGKRSLALDLNLPAGRGVLRQLIERADVFTTNLRGAARRRMGIEPQDLFQINPKLIYARGTGYGLHGPLASQGGFDFPSAWCRGGLAYIQSEPGAEPPPAPGSVGDLTGGLAFAGAISAALFRRERTGRGAIVDNALYLVGAYLASQAIVMSSLRIPRAPPGPREAGFSALAAMYKTKDGRWLNLMLLIDKWWPDFCRHAGRIDLIDDVRFVDAAGRFANRAELMSELDATFARHTLTEWERKLETMEGVWAPVFSPDEVAADHQALANGFVIPVSGVDETDYKVGASPAQFDERPIGPLSRAPRYGEHTEAVMAQLGLDAEAVASLRAAGAIL